MKQKITFIAIVLSFVFTSCKKTNDDNTNTNNNSSTQKIQVSMLVDGVAYSVTTGEVNDNDIKAHIANDRNRFNLQAAKGDKDFSITHYNAKIDTLNTIQNNGLLTFAQWEEGTNIYTTISNSKSRLNYLITKKNEYITGFHLVEGSFYGVLYNTSKSDSVVITNGLIKLIN